MKKLETSILFICGCMVFVSCNFTGKLTKRYYDINIKQDDAYIQSNIGVDAYILQKENADPPKPKTIFDLSEKGQQELIRQAGNNEPANDKLMASLASSLSAKSASSVDLIDYTKSEKRVLVSIRNLSHWPADRISKITINLKINNADFRLLSCNRLQTETQTLDLAKLNYSNTNSVELNASSTAGVSATTGGTGSIEKTTSDTDGNLTTGSDISKSRTNTNTINGATGLSGKFNAARSFAEEVLLKQKIVTLNATISKNTLSLYQEGISGIDLSGNILADIVFDSPDNIKVVSSYSFSEVKPANLPDKLVVKEVLVKFFNYENPVIADLTYSADFRHVTKRHSTITESDDIVELYYGNNIRTPQKVTLVAKDQLKPKMWVLVDKRDAALKPLQIFNPANNGKGELILTSVADAKDFLTWVQLQKANILTRGGALGILGFKIFNPDGTAIDAAIISNLTIGVSQ